MDDLDPEEYARTYLWRGDRLVWRMPFGKNKGKPLSALPDSELLMLAYVVAVEPLRNAVIRELWIRHPYGPPCDDHV